MTCHNVSPSQPGLHQLAQDWYPYLLEHLHLSPDAFVLQHLKRLGDKAKFLGMQLYGLQKARHKLPEWFGCPGIVYPSRQAVEQASSQITAGFKASIIPPGMCGIDLTGGLGADTCYLARVSSRWQYVEQDPQLAYCAQGNLAQLGLDGVEVHVADSQGFIDTIDRQAQVVYLDPSRRVGGQRVYGPGQYQPDPIALQGKLLQRFGMVLCKYSPMVDLDWLARHLQQLEALYVVAVKNECREILSVQRVGHTGPLRRVAVHWTGQSAIPQVYEAYNPEVPPQAVGVPSVWRYILEPNAAIIKLGATGQLGTRYGLRKPHANTQLLLSDSVPEGFPGRVFEVIEGPLDRANVLVRNHKASAADLVKRYGITEGADNDYLIACTVGTAARVFYARMVPGC
ncbi:MAG: class I SAM-dependent methyltransferase [Bacteroidetes bacterium]|nr:class I SAM-dependent methyltransferase [Bacteroidota bacterium]